MLERSKCAQVIILRMPFFVGRPTVVLQAEQKAKMAVAASQSARAVEKDYDEIVALLEAEVAHLKAQLIASPDEKVETGFSFFLFFLLKGGMKPIFRRLFLCRTSNCSTTASARLCWVCSSTRPCRQSALTSRLLKNCWDSLVYDVFFFFF